MCSIQLIGFNSIINQVISSREFTTPINVLLNASKVLKSSGIKKEVENDLLSCMALQVGLEPTTYGLTVRRSNQLSY